MDLEPNIWGPHYWFFLHSITFTYPKKPTSATKKNIMILYTIYHCLFHIKKYQKNL